GEFPSPMLRTSRALAATTPAANAPVGHPTFCRTPASEPAPNLVVDRTLHGIAVLRSPTLCPLRLAGTSHLPASKAVRNASKEPKSRIWHASCGFYLGRESLLYQAHIQPRLYQVHRSPFRFPRERELLYQA